MIAKIKQNVQGEANLDKLMEKHITYGSINYRASHKATGCTNYPAIPPLVTHVTFQFFWSRRKLELIKVHHSGNGCASHVDYYATGMYCKKQ